MAEVKKRELLRTARSWDGASLAALVSRDEEIVSIRYEFGPGEKLGWHHHDVLNFGVVERGELTIVDVDGNVKVFRAGEALVEMVGTVHHGENNGSEAVVLIMFYLAPKGVALSVPHPELPPCD